MAADFAAAAAAATCLRQLLMPMPLRCRHHTVYGPAPAAADAAGVSLMPPDISMPLLSAFATLMIRHAAVIDIRCAALIFRR